MLSFTKDELIKMKNGLEYLHKSINLSLQYFNECVELVKKIDYQIEHLDRQEKTAAKFHEWQKQLKDQRNERIDT